MNAKWRIHRVDSYVTVEFAGLTLPARPAGWQVTDPNCRSRTGYLTIHVFNCRCRRVESFPAAITHAATHARAQMVAAIQDGAA